MIEYKEGCKWCDQRRGLEEIVRKVIREEILNMLRIQKESRA